MMHGDKTCTSRNKRYGQAGDRFEAFGHTFELTKVERMRLKDVRDMLYKQEGCQSPKEFYDIWVKLHPRKGFIAEQLVWVHYFRKVEL